MLDKYGRNIDYLRISVTDRCNLRCTYCMPEGGVEQFSCQEILSYEEILRLCRLFAELGIRKIKVTGGEPLVRAGICDFIGAVKQIKGIEQVTLTTNGVLLGEMAAGLLAAGLDGINVSLDSLQEDSFAKITRRRQLQPVLAGIGQLLDRGYENIKINCVPLQSMNDDQLAEIASMAKNQAISVRFIELMPIGCAAGYTPVPQEIVMRLLEQRYGRLEPGEPANGNGPARYYSLPGFRGKIGFIDALEHKFCGRCNRIRLTANGFLKLCLQYNYGVDVKSLLRRQVGDAALKMVIAQHIYEKPQEHHFSGAVPAAVDGRNMFQVGG